MADAGTPSRASAPFGWPPAAAVRFWLPAVALVLIGPFLIFANKGMVPLIAVMTLAVLATTDWRRVRPWPTNPGLAASAGLFIAWALVSTAWAIVPAETFDQGWRMGLVFLLGFLVLRSAEADAYWRDGAWHRVVAVMGLVFLGLLWIELLSTAWIRRQFTGETAAFIIGYDPRVWGAAGISLFAWPTAYALWRWLGRWPAALFLAAAGGATAISDMGAAPVAFAAAGLAVIAWLLLGRWLIRLWTAAAVTVMLLSPAVVSTVLEPKSLERWCETLAPSHAHRLFIWERAAQRAWEQPLGGWGFNASRSMPDSKDIVPCLAGQFAPFISLHPHNAALQVWLEVGAVGAVIAAAFVLALGRRLLALADRPAILAIIPMVVGYWTIGLLSYGAWQNWWLVTAWALTFVAAALLGADRARETAQAS